MRVANQDVGIDRPRDLVSNAVRSDRGYAWAHYTSLAVALIVLLFASRGLWFFYDEWDFISSRGLHHPALGLFAPHNEHWSTLPILSYRVLLTIFGLHTYLPYLLVLFLVHLVLVHLLWGAMRNLPVHPMIAVGLAAVFALLGSGAQNLLWAFQVGFVASLCLGWAFVLCCGSARWSRSVVLAGWAWGIAALMCSGLGVTMVVMGGLAALLARGWRRASVLVSVPLVAFAIWYAAVGHTTAHAGSPSIDRMSGYIGTGIGNALTHLIGLTRVGTWVGVVIGLGALAAVVTRILRFRSRDAARPGVWTRLRAYPVVVASVVGVLVLWIITAAGRAGLGNVQALSSRYGYNTVAVGLPALALALDTGLAALVGRVRLSARRFTMAVVALALTGVLLVANVWQLPQARRVQLRLDQLSRAQILTAGYLMRHGAPYLPGAKAAGIFAPNLDAANLDRIARSGWLTVPTAVSWSAELTVRADMQDL